MLTVLVLVIPLLLLHSPARKEAGAVTEEGAAFQVRAGRLRVGQFLILALIHSLAVMGRLARDTRTSGSMCQNGQRKGAQSTEACPPSPMPASGLGLLSPICLGKWLHFLGGLGRIKNKKNIFCLNMKGGNPP